MRYSCIRDVSVFELSTYTRTQLIDLAARIVSSQQSFLDAATATELADHCAGELEFGIRIGKGGTVVSRCKRVTDQSFWFRRLSQVASRTRETIAVRSGLVGRADLYCSSESFNDYLVRQSVRSVTTRKKLQRQFERAATQSYLITKAACDRAFDQGHLSVLITLGLDARYGHSFADGYKALQKMLDSLLENLSHFGERGVDFYGARCVEVHKDGCPHFHVILYINRSLLPRLKAKLADVHHIQSQAMGTHFDLCSDKILQVRYPKERKLYGEAVSYLFKNSYSGRDKDSKRFERSIRQKAVISIYGKHQYELIGMNGIASILREAPKHLRLGEMSSALGLKCIEDRYKNWMTIIQGLISGGRNRFKVIRSEMENRYGERVKRITDVQAVAGAAFKICIDSKPDVGVTSNYSRYSCTTNNTASGRVPHAIKLPYRSRAPPDL